MSSEDTPRPDQGATQDRTEPPPGWERYSDYRASGVLAAVLQRRMNEATTREGQDAAGADVLRRLAEESS